jgi:hypothetical protein
MTADDLPFSEDEALAFALDLMEAAISDDPAGALEGVEERAEALDPDGDALIFAVVYMLLESICHYFNLGSDPDRLVGIGVHGDPQADPDGQAWLTAVRLVASYANQSDNTKFLLRAAFDADDTGEAGARVLAALLRLFALGHERWKASQ